MKNNKRLLKLFKWLTAIFIVAVVILAAWWGWVRSHSDSLWKIISQQCIPQQQMKQSQVSSCMDVILTPDVAKGYVIFKDRNGPLHFLLIPATKVSGIEDKRLLQPDTTDYFSKAWDSRDYLARQAGQPIPRNMVALTINSAYGRSQEQLHIHISCIKPEIKALLDNQMDKFSEKWTKVEYGINNHDYIARTLTELQFRQMSLFQRLAAEVPDAAENMAKYGIALVPFTNKANTSMYLMLANRLDILGLNLGYTGDIQDYHCDLLKTSQIF
ncbi:CDP-diacylglycerol diphosphatase [Pragia fontium]|uniref:CDP-diacylglycerol pyrophosphatase n=1 Tax=Pragia fontium DSM 5563 = ATCC 49100 TaxID=1122977 RepID=A0AAJ4W867_9GAMM|nr:CDP-diacylglycerol diphosphatase [Pragia fontium]SFC10956.1 CDP-diacylglycerol pyrophosphatase [Pragia fontium DSM 5563 = ATCC 49100]SUB81391.1 CDP-diacylglycerol pyrophosphatase [Pragia fontium]VEJ53619.1 CDP-diacylglycerol pyrophosphatase [Pragia fontium]